MELGTLAMSQVKQIRRGGIAATSRHNMREDKERWSTEHVDITRSRYNTILIGHSTGDDIRDDIAGCDMAHNTKRNPMNDPIAAEFVLAPSREWLAHILGETTFNATQKSCEKLLANPEFLRWLIAATECLKKERCISAVLHMDESVPHIHAVCSVKIKRESTSKSEKSKRRSKKSEYVLSYTKYYGTRGQDYILATSSGEKRKKLEEKYGKTYDSLSTPLGQLQTRIWEQLGKPFMMGRGEAASTTGIKGKSVKEWRIEQGKKKVDAEVNKELEDYTQKKRQEIAEKKKSINLESQSEISSFAEEKKFFVLSQKAVIEEKSRTEIEEFSSRINIQSKRKIKEYEEKKKKEVEEEIEKINKNNSNTLEFIRRKEEEFILSSSELQNEIEKQIALNNQLISLHNEENIKKQNLINNIKSEIEEKVNLTKIAILSYIKQLDKFTTSFGYSIEKIGALEKLTIFRNRIMADARMKTGRQIRALRETTVKHLEKTISICENIEKIEKIIEDSTPKL